LLSKFSNKRFRGADTGFTIVELMVAMAVAAILMGMALPAFNTFIDQRTMAARVNDFVVAVNLARSEAANRGAPVSIQAMDASANGNEWGPGYCVTVGTPGNCNAPLRNFQAADQATMNGLGGLNGIGTLTYNGRGLLTLGAQGTIELCSTSAAIDPGREIAINTVGRASSVEFVCNP
jgi:prepilin-type N-terminal cleavage/methylation domain-containing protein